MGKKQFSIFWVIAVLVAFLCSTVWARTPSTLRENDWRAEQRFHKGFKVLGGDLTVDGGLIRSQQGSDEFFVGSRTGQDTLANDYGKSWEKPFDTINYAIDQCTTLDRNIIYVLSGSSIVISGTSPLGLDKTGLHIIGLGNGTNRPWLDFTTSGVSISDVEFDSPGIEFENFYIDISGVSGGITAAMDIDAPDVTIRNCEFIMSAASGYNAQAAIILDSAADRFKLINCTFRSGVTSGLNLSTTLAGVTLEGTTPPDSVVIVGNEFVGYFSSAPVYVHSGVSAAVAKSWTVEGNRYHLINDGYETLELSNASIPLFPVSAGPFASSKTWVGGVTNLFSVHGPIRLKSMIGVVTTAIATNSTLTMNILVDPIEPAGNTNLCAGTVISADAAGTIYTFSGVSDQPMVPVTNGVISKYSGAMSGARMAVTSATSAVMLPPEGMIIPSGHIEFALSDGKSSTTGEIEWHIVWEPLKPGASVRPD